MSRVNSPTSSSPTKKIPLGFIAPKRAPTKRLEELTERELNDLHSKNHNILMSNTPSTSDNIARIAGEQAAIEARLALLSQQHAPDQNMLDARPRILAVKQRIIERAFENLVTPRGGSIATEPLGFAEAIALERAAHEAEREKRERTERKRNANLPQPGEILTPREREARIWAYMNFRPSESDEEDEDEDEDEDFEYDPEDPSTWQQDMDYDTQGQDIIEPDELDHIIKVDRQRLGGYSFYNS